MRSIRRRASVIDDDRGDEPPRGPDRAADAADALALAEEAEAEAAEAEATAAAARARARAIRLRRQAAASEASVSDAAQSDVDTASDVEYAETTEVEAPPTDVSDPEPETATALDEDVSADETDEDDEEQVVAEASEDRVRWWRGWSLGRILKVVAAGLTVICIGALITVSVIMVTMHRNAERDQRLNAEYAAAARQSVVTLMSLDFNNAQANVQRIIDNSTGTFKDDFQNQAADFVKVAQDSKVITEVAVNTTGVESMTNDTATVLVSATSRVTNAAGAKQEPRAWRLSVGLQREGDQIKMSKVEFVP